MDWRKDDFPSIFLAISSASWLSHLWFQKFWDNCRYIVHIRLALPSQCPKLTPCEDEGTQIIVLTSWGHFFPNSILLGIKCNENSLFSLELFKEFGTQHVTPPPEDEFDLFAITATGDHVVTFVEILPGFSTFSTKTSSEMAVLFKILTYLKLR